MKLKRLWTALSELQNVASRWPKFAIALVLTGVLAFHFRDVVFFGRTFLMINQTAGTMPDNRTAFGYPGISPAADRMAVHDPGALGWEIEPSVFYTRACLLRGEFANWNPHSGMGNPHLAAGYASVLDPLNLIIYLAPRSQFALAYDVEVLATFFIAGFFTALFLRQIGLRTAAATCGGCGYMLMNFGFDAGNHPAFRVACIMPVVFYTFDLLVERPRFRNYCFATGAVAWIFFADFAEQAFLSFVFTCCWYAIRSALLVWRSPNRLGEAFAKVYRLAIPLTLGFLIGASVIFPFLQNVAVSDHVHKESSGSGVAAWPLTYALAGFIPYYKFSPVGTNWLPHYHVVLLFLAMLAIVSLLLIRRDSTGRTATIFFGLYFSFFAFKQFGVSEVQWIGQLPIYRQVLLVRYLTPTLEFSLAALAAVAVNNLILNKISSREVLLAVLVFLGLFGLVAFWNLVPETTWSLRGLSKSVLKTGFVAGVIIAFLAFRTSFRWSTSWTSLGIIVCLLIEITSWHHDVVRPVRYDPYTTPPFVEFLKGEPEVSRVYGRGMTLYPNISMVYGIDDVRHVTALDPTRRRLFLQNFVVTDYGLVRFTGDENQIQYNKFFDLLNIRYVLVPETLDSSFRVSLSSLPGFSDSFSHPPQVQPTQMSINGHQFQGIFMHPPSTCGIAVDVPTMPRVALAFGIALDPRVWDAPGNDGAGFTVLLKDETGVHTLFHQVIDPRARIYERRCIPIDIDLTHWAGQKVELSFATDGGLAGDTSSDWAFWAEPTVVASNETGISTNLETAFMEQNSFVHGSAMRLSQATINGDCRESVFMHAPVEGGLNLHIPDSGAVLKIGIGMDPKIITDPPVGDGVTFKIDLIYNGITTRLLSQYIDPKHDPAARKWTDFRLELNRWSGKDVELVFGVDGGPANNTAADWAHWTIHLDAAGVPAPKKSKFELVYDHDIRIYKNHDAFPRAFVVHSVVAATDMDNAVQLMKATGFDPGTTAVVDGPSADSISKLLPASSGSKSTSHAEVTARSANSMTIRATLDKPGLLVVSETFFPGWNAYVDGKSVPIHPTDVMLRGIYLEAGEHTVEMLYRPLPLLVGCGLAGLAVMILIGWGGYLRWRSVSTKLVPATSDKQP